MSVANELNGHALHEHRQREQDLLRAVQAEALNLERLPEGEDPRDPLIVDGVLIRQPAQRRIHGKLTVRW